MRKKTSPQRERSTVKGVNDAAPTESDGLSTEKNESWQMYNVATGESIARGNLAIIDSIDIEIARGVGNALRILPGNCKRGYLSVSYNKNEIGVESEVKEKIASLGTRIPKFLEDVIDLKGIGSRENEDAFVIAWSLTREGLDALIVADQSLMPKPDPLAIKIPDDRLKAVQAVFSGLSGSASQRLPTAIGLTHAFRAELIEFLEPAFREVLQTNPPDNLEDRLALMKQLNDILRELGLAIRHPTTGEPCSLMGDQYRIRLQPKDRRSSVSSSITEIEPLNLMEAPRREGRSSRLRNAD